MAPSALKSEEMIENPTVGQVVEKMIVLARDGAENDTGIRNLAASICAGVQSGDYASEALAIYEWVYRNIRYTRDIEGVELVTWPRGTVELGCGDCDDMSILLAALMMSLGAPCSFVLVAFRPDGIPEHVFCRVETSRGPMVLDPVANSETTKMLGTVTASVVVPCTEASLPSLQSGVLNGVPFNGWSGPVWR